MVKLSIAPVAPPSTRPGSDKSEQESDGGESQFDDDPGEEDFADDEARCVSKQCGNQRSV
eukprot:910295-Pelagomonas_calceolata.AAC.8